MNRQQFYRREYRRIRGGWKDSGTIYREIVAGSIRPETRVLDVGCGHRGFLRDVYVTVRHVCGIDPNEGALRRNEVIPQRVAGLAGELPFRDGSFDLVVSAWVVEHLDDPEGAFREIHRVLRPGGKVVFLTPNAWNYSTWIIRLVPNRRHARLARRFYERDERDTYPVRYRMNTLRKIDHTLGSVGLRKARVILNGDPTYISFNGTLFRLACLVERLLDRRPLRWAKVHIIGVFEKPPSAVPSGVH